MIGAAGLLGYYVRTARRARAASLAERARRLERDREQQAQLAVAAERARIARELHDIVAHNIAMMIALSDGAAATALKSPAQAVTLMGDISTAGRAALTEMRRLLGVLRQPVSADHTPQPGLADIDGLLAGVRTAGLPTRLTITGEPADMPASAQLALYRMVQEALTNTLKHAPGAHAEVRLSYRPGEVELEVTDDGRSKPGPAAATQPGARRTLAVPVQGDQNGGGHGIVGMRERAAVFGGAVSAEPRPGGGWRVHTVLGLGASGPLAGEDGA
jgi:signal transduction histidine kinase